jgi:hypothetical protein
MKRLPRLILILNLWAAAALLLAALPAAAGTPGEQKWAFTTGYLVNSSPAVGADGSVYVGSNDHKLYAVKPDGTQKWAFTTGNVVTSSPALSADGTVYVGSWDGKLYAVYSDSPGLMNSSWPMFHHDLRHTGFQPIKPPPTGILSAIYLLLD